MSLAARPSWNAKNKASFGKWPSRMPATRLVTVFVCGYCPGFGMETVVVMIMIFFHDVSD